MAIGAIGALGAGAAGGAGVTIIISAIDKFSGVFANVNKSMLAVGAGITAMGIAGAIGMKKFIDTSISFESAFAGVKKTVELTEAEFAELDTRFKEMSSTLPITYEELAGIGEIAGQLGVEGVDNIAKFTKVIADISVTTNMTAEQAATDFARIANVMGVPISDVDRMGSAIVDLGNNFATTEGEIVNMTMRIMGAGKTIGLNTQEVFGMSAALSALGIRSEMGGSAISRAMIVIAKSVATGSDELAKYAEVSGMTIDEFSAAWKDKPVEAMSAVIIGLKRISESGGNTFGVLEDLDLKSIRITDTMLRLAGSQDGITRAVDMSKIAWEENTALVDEANKRYGTTESKVKILKGKMRALADTMGDVLIPAFTIIIEKLSKFMDWMEEHPKLTKFAIIALAVGTALALIVGPLLIMVALLPAIAAGLGFAAAGLTAVSIAGLPVWAVLGLIAIAIGLLIAGGYLLIKHWDKVKEAGVEMGVMLKNVFIGIHNVVISVWSGIVNFIEKSINRIINMVNRVISSLNRIPGINLGEFSDINLGRFKGTMMEYATYMPPAPTEMTTAAPVNVINITDNNIYGTDPEEIAEALQETIQNKVSMG